jgi:hypothetical protein
MPGIVLAWLAGEALIIYRSYKQEHRPPMPGQLLASSALFATLGALARDRDAAFLAGALAWGFDIAAFYNLAPSLMTGNQAATTAKTTAPKKEAKAT